MNLLVCACVCAALLLSASALEAPVSARIIPASSGNQDFFALAQSIFAYGTRRIDGCGGDFAEIERCILACNRPGLPDRGNCCCTVVGNGASSLFYVGIKGGCRYSQSILNYTTDFIYFSKPLDSSEKKRYFDSLSCAADSFKRSGSGSPCSCSVSWDVDVETLKKSPTLPTPSPSPTPVLTNSPSPSVSASPLPPSSSPTVTPSVSAGSSMSPSITPMPSTSSSPSIGATTTPSVSASSTPRSSPNTIVPKQESPTPSFSESPIAVVITPGPTDSVIDPTESPTLNPTTSSSSEGTPSPSVSDGTNPEPTEEDDSVCVDHEYLVKMGVPVEHLIHPTPFEADVFCPVDSTLPCGTSNHKVRMSGKDLSYKQLCSLETIVCRKNRMPVNGVYTHKWADVQHDQVALTMYDVRYSEIAQRQLHRVMHGWRRAMA